MMMMMSRSDCGSLRLDSTTATINVNESGCQNQSKTKMFNETRSTELNKIKRKRPRRRRWKFSTDDISNINDDPVAVISSSSSNSTNCDIQNDDTIDSIDVSLYHYRQPLSSLSSIFTSDLISINNNNPDDGIHTSDKTRLSIESSSFAAAANISAINSAIYQSSMLLTNVFVVFVQSIILDVFKFCFVKLPTTTTTVRCRQRHSSSSSSSSLPYSSSIFYSTSSRYPKSLQTIATRFATTATNHLMLSVLCLLLIESSLTYYSSTTIDTKIRWLPSTFSTPSTNVHRQSCANKILANLDFLFGNQNHRQFIDEHDVDENHHYRSIFGIFVGASKNYAMLLEARRHQSQQQQPPQLAQHGYNGPMQNSYFPSTTTNQPSITTNPNYLRVLSKPVYSSYLRTSAHHAQHASQNPYGTQSIPADLLAADSISLETYQQQLQNNQSSSSSSSLLHQSPTEGVDQINQTTSTQAKLKASIKSYPIGDQNQQFCDSLLVAPPSGGGSVDPDELMILDSDTIIQQRVIVESEQLELFLHLRPDRPTIPLMMVRTKNGTLAVDDPSGDDSDFGLDDLAWETPETIASRNEIDRLQCMQMLKLQLEKGGPGKRRPLFELATGTFNVSCYVVPGPQFQCALFSYNMHHYSSIFKGHKEPYCSSTFVRFNLLDTRCRLNLVLKRINPFKFNSDVYSDSVSSSSSGRSQGQTTNRRRNSHNSKPYSANSKLPPPPLPITSSIWDTFQESSPVITGPSGPYDSESCATMCQKMFQDHGSSSSSSSNGKTAHHSVRRRFNPNELIFIENVRPKCLLQFDQSSVRARLKSSSKSSSLNHFGHSSAFQNRADSSGSISTQNGGPDSNQDSSPQNSPSNDIAKKTCIESSRHIITHNGLVIQHPTLKIVPVGSAALPPPSGSANNKNNNNNNNNNNETRPLLSNIVAGQTLPAMEFVLQVESKNLSSNAQYFDLVLKKYKWTATISLLYPDIYPGVLTGQTSVPVQSVHYRSKEYENSYFRFTFNNLKVTKWGYRYLLKISLRSNPACYTIETTYGPFDVQFRTRHNSPKNDNTRKASATTTPSSETANGTEPNMSEKNVTDNSVRFVWTSQKCHSLRIELQASVVMDRSSGHQIWMPPPGQDSSGSSALHHQSSIPISRTIDYLCELNLEKLGTFLINFLSNRAVNNAGELLPSQLRRASFSKDKQTRQQQQQQQQQLLVHRNFFIDNEHSYVTFVDNFIRNQRLAINGSQCLEMIFKSKNVSLIATDNSSNGHKSQATSSASQSDQISRLFNAQYQQFKNYHRQLLLQRLINMTFIYSSELLLKIKQIYLDDSPLHQPPPPPPPPPAPSTSSTTTTTSTPSSLDKNQPVLAKPINPDLNNRNVEKRRTINNQKTRNTEKHDNDESAEDERTIETTQSPKRTLSKKPKSPSSSSTQLFKTTYPQVVFGSRASSPTASREKPTKRPSGNKSGKIQNKSNKKEQKEEESGNSLETGVPEKSSSSFLSGRPLLWILILFANTLLVFAFVITFAICYYRKMFAEATDPSRNKPLHVPNARKPLKPYAGTGPGPVKSLSSKHRDGGGRGDDIFMLEKTDYSSASSDDPYTYTSGGTRHQQYQNGGPSPNSRNQPVLRQSVQKVQNVQRATRKSGASRDEYREGPYSGADQLHHHHPGNQTSTTFVTTTTASASSSSNSSSGRNSRRYSCHNNAYNANANNHNSHSHGNERGRNSRTPNPNHISSTSTSNHNHNVKRSKLYERTANYSLSNFGSNQPETVVGPVIDPYDVSYPYHHQSVSLPPHIAPPPPTTTRSNRNHQLPYSNHSTHHHMASYHDDHFNRPW